jgi:hypothetical protein
VPSSEGERAHFLKCTLNAPPKRLRIRVQRSRPKQKHLHEPSASVCCRLGIRGRSLNIFQRWMDRFLRHADALASMGFSFKVVGWMAGWKREKSKSDRDNFAACTVQMLQVFPCRSASRLRRHKRIILTFETSHRRDSRRHRAIKPAPSAGGHFHSSICGVSL